MLQVARLAPKLLGESRDLCLDFVTRQRHPDGGFRNRAGDPDLYYTVFGCDCLIALRAEVPVAPLVAYLAPLGDGEGLDFVHLCCLARAWAALPRAVRPAATLAGIAARLAGFRAADGGFAPQPGAPYGSVYAAFLALGAYQDCGVPLPDRDRLHASLAGLRARDGGFANHPAAQEGVTTATAAAVLLLRHLGGSVPAELASWLLARHYPRGGFFATPGATVPDLLSTATALHALAALHVPLDPIREPCLDFLDSLWCNRGGFYGHWADDGLDCEYLFYALLALGHLAV